MNTNHLPAEEQYHVFCEQCEEHLASADTKMAAFNRAYDAGAKRVPLVANGKKTTQTTVMCKSCLDKYPTADIFGMVEPQS